MTVECFDLQFAECLIWHIYSVRVDVFLLCFRWSIPMAMSITHRGTGLGLSGGNTSVFSWSSMTKVIDMQVNVIVFPS